LISLQYELLHQYSTFLHGVFAQRLRQRAMMEVQVPAMLLV
jgi:hypothetical protein